jgi:transcriptional regulator with XRE-family HTH domain
MNVRTLRRTAGMTQEGLAEAAELSTSSVRKAEQGGDVSMATIAALARGLGVDTSALFASEAPRPVVGPEDESNRRSLAELRRALMPPLGLTMPTAAPGEAQDPHAVQRGVADGHALYQADKYDAVARTLPALLRGSEAAVAILEGDERVQAQTARAHALLLTGKYLTQVRQYDMAYYALTEGIRLAQATGQTQLAATGVNGLCWLLLRQDRFDESEQLAAETAELIEPRMSTATPDQLAIWGELWLRVAAASRRNGRDDVTRQARRMAATAGRALDREHTNFPAHWSAFGPVTVSAKAVEDMALDGNARSVVNSVTTDKGLKHASDAPGLLSTNNWGRHRLDVAGAYVKLGSHQDAMDVLVSVKDKAETWITHQPLARRTMKSILKTRKRTLTQDMRDMAAHLGVNG